MSPLSIFEKQIENLNHENIRFRLSKELEIEIYPNSINKYKNALFFIGKKDIDKNLFIVSEKENLSAYNFEGEVFSAEEISSQLYYKKCPLIHNNALLLQDIFPYTRPVVIGLSDSFGYGDRIGIANPGHVKVSMKYKFKPIFAQQSIRELTRTQRTPDEITDAAVWAVFQEGYKDGYGADADHLKTKENVDLMMKAGFTFFTIDSGDYVDNSADKLKEEELLKKATEIDFKPINEICENILRRYLNKTFNIGDEISITPSSYEVLNAIVKYGRCFIHIKNLTSYMQEKYSSRKYEVEISIDETNTHTTPFDHFFIVNELRRLKIDFVSIAPHFVGGFEKGIDYKDDINKFADNFKIHSTIVKHFGNYKLSFHSGSDKFKIYKKVAEFKDRGPIHIKTAGTSYLVALNVVAIKDPGLFREILDFSVEEYKIERESYHVSANLEEIRKSVKYSDEELPELFFNDSVRQVLHVAFGKILTEKNSGVKFIFKDRIKDCLMVNEDLHYKLLVEHFDKHLNPFK